jgi:uncharacterized protein with FMN-binding domain
VPTISSILTALTTDHREDRQWLKRTRRQQGTNIDAYRATDGCSSTERFRLSVAMMQKRRIATRATLCAISCFALTSCVTSGAMSLQITGALKNGQFTGQDITTQYGDVQVQITVSNGQITDVQAPLLPNERARSQEISQNAGPQLHDEVLQSVSCHSNQIDTVSGVTYTSDGYVQSPQSAIDQAHE